MAFLHNLTIIDEVTGKHFPIIEIDSQVTADDIIKAVGERLHVPQEKRRGFITRKTTHKAMLHNQTLQSAGIEDNETLILDWERTAGGGIVVNSIRDIQIINAYLSHHQVSSYHHYGLYAIFLYTDADKELANFVKNNFLELHNLSGNHCAFYILERPAPEWIPSIKKELTLGSYTESVWKLLEKKQFTPIDSASVYEVAKYLDVNRSQLPCIVFFSNLESKELLVIPFETLFETKLNSVNHQEFLMVFRGLFDKVDISVKKSEGERLKSLKQEISRMKRDKALPMIESIVLPEAIKGVIGMIIKFIVA